MNRHAPIALLAACLITLSGAPAHANSLTYAAPTGDQPGKFTGDLPLSRIGLLALPDGIVRFASDEMLVEAVPDWLFDREPVLRGVIVRAEIAAQQSNSVVAGLVFFLDGIWLDNLAPRKVLEELIITTSDEEIRGRITGRSGQDFIVRSDKGSRKIAFSEVKSISSPRAFSFNIATPTARLSPTDSTLSFESNLITLLPASSQARVKPGRASVPPCKLAGADAGISKRTIAIFVALDIFSEIAPAIAAPLVLNRTTQHHAMKQISDALQSQYGTTP